MFPGKAAEKACSSTRDHQNKSHDSSLLDYNCSRLNTNLLDAFKPPMLLGRQFCAHLHQLGRHKELRLLRWHG
eukprot:617398-Amphidinium_carterae.2